MNEEGRDFLLPVVVGDRLAEKAMAIGSAQRLKRIGVEAVAADSRKDRIKQAAGKSQRRVRRAGRGGIEALAEHPGGIIPQRVRLARSFPVTSGPGRAFMR